MKWEALDHAEAQEIVSRIFDSDGGEDVASWIGNSGEVSCLPVLFLVANRSFITSATTDHTSSSFYISTPSNVSVRVLAGQLSLRERHPSY